MGKFLTTVLFILVTLIGFFLSGSGLILAVCLAGAVGFWTVILSIPSLALVIGSFLYILDHIDL